MSCNSLASALQRSNFFQVVATTVPNKAFQLLQESSFDVVLVGFQSGGEAGANFIHRLYSLYPAVGIVALIDSRRRSTVVEVLAAGARGVLCRSDSLKSVGNCIQCVHAGQVWAGSAELGFVLDAIFKTGSTAKESTGSSPLSRREEEIATLVAEGQSNRQISSRLGLSEHTVKNYLFRMFEKIGVSTRVELTLHMLRQTQGGKSTRPPVPGVRFPGPILLPGGRSNPPVTSATFPIHPDLRASEK
jgi:DNA-binding NarL/FixJ family response regulator